MSRLLYDIPLSEENMPWWKNKDGYQRVEYDIPHFRQIKAWLPGEWDGCQVTFDGLLAGKVKCTRMTCYRKNINGRAYAFARVTVEFLPGVRVSRKMREACFNQLEGQMTDGFGESYDGREIPGADGWRLAL